MEWKTRVTFAMLGHVYVTFVFLCDLTPLESIYSIGEQLLNKQVTSFSTCCSITCYCCLNHYSIYLLLLILIHVLRFKC